jgi:hypothetical protein
LEKKMNKKLRQKIVKELNFILREQMEQPAEAGGTGIMSEDLDDIVEDINDSDKESIAGHSFLNLTNFGDETDEGEIAKLISFAKTVEKQEDLTDQKTINAFNKICETPLLLINRAGPVDTFFYVSCRKIGSLNTPFSVRKLVDEGDEAALTMLMNKIKGMPVTPVGVPKECPDKSEPVEKLPDGTQKCKDGTIIKPDVSPTPAPGKYPQGSMKCKKCSDINVGCVGPDVAEIQKALSQKVSGFSMSHPEVSSQTFGQATAEAVIKFKESGNFLSPPFTPKVGASTAKALGIKCGSGGSGSKKSSEDKSSAKPDSSSGSIATGIQYKCPAGQKYVPGTGKCSDGSDPTMVKESKNFYDNKKLTEAKKLFNKLMKNL